MTSFELREPCIRCGSLEGEIKSQGNQEGAYCLRCGKWNYWAPHSETGRKPRSVKTGHSNITPGKRIRVIERAKARCELCSATTTPLHVGHIMSVKDGLELGLTEYQVGHEANLAAMCEECNLGLSSLSLSPIVYVSLVKIRVDSENE